MCVFFFFFFDILLDEGLFFYPVQTIKVHGHIYILLRYFFTSRNKIYEFLFASIEETRLKWSAVN